MNQDDFSNSQSTPAIIAGSDLGELFTTSLSSMAPVAGVASQIFSVGRGAKAVWQGYQNFQQNRFIRRFEILINKLREETISPEDRSRFQDAIQNSADREKIIEVIMTNLERLDEDEKIGILVKITYAWSAGQVNFLQYRSILACLDKAYIGSLDFLRELGNNGFQYTSSKSINPLYEAQLFAAGIGHREGQLFLVTELGRDLYTYGLN